MFLGLYGIGSIKQGVDWERTNKKTKSQLVNENDDRIDEGIRKTGHGDDVRKFKKTLPRRRRRRIRWKVTEVLEIEGG